MGKKSSTETFLKKKADEQQTLELDMYIREHFEESEFGDSLWTFFQKVSEMSGERFVVYPIFEEWRTKYYKSDGFIYLRKKQVEQ